MTYSISAAFLLELAIGAFVVIAAVVVLLWRRERR